MSSCVPWPPPPNCRRRRPENPNRETPHASLVSPMAVTWDRGFLLIEQPFIKCLPHTKHMNIRRSKRQRLCPPHSGPHSWLSICSSLRLQQDLMLAVQARLCSDCLPGLIGQGVVPDRAWPMHSDQDIPSATCVLVTRLRDEEEEGCLRIMAKRPCISLLGASEPILSSRIFKWWYWSKLGDHFRNCLILPFWKSILVVEFFLPMQGCKQKAQKKRKHKVGGLRWRKDEAFRPQPLDRN